MLLLVSMHIVPCNFLCKNKTFWCLLIISHNSSIVSICFLSRRWEHFPPDTFNNCIYCLIDVNCRRRPPSVAGSISYSILRDGSTLHDGEVAKYGDIVQYKCRSGMIPVGPNIKCGSNKKWTKSRVKCACK